MKRKRKDDFSFSNPLLAELWASPSLAANSLSVRFYHFIKNWDRHQLNKRERESQNSN